MICTIIDIEEYRCKNKIEIPAHLNNQFARIFKKNRQIRLLNEAKSEEHILRYFYENKLSNKKSIYLFN
jgi:formate dehydrogenase maturation protein FdhE